MRIIAVLLKHSDIGIDHFEFSCSCHLSEASFMTFAVMSKFGETEFVACLVWVFVC